MIRRSPAATLALLAALAVVGTGCAQTRVAELRERLFGPRQSAAAEIDPSAGTIMQAGASVLASAEALETESRLYSGRSNSLRKKLGVLRLAQRQTSDEKVRIALEEPLDALVEEMEAWQERAHQVRTRATQLDVAARLLLIEGFSDLHGRWISNPAPLVMAQVSYESADAQNLPESMRGMSIQVTQLVGQTVPPELNVSSFQVSQTRKLLGHIEVEPEPEGSTTIPVNEIHRWRLVLSDLEGRPVENAKISIAGGMPGHAHGLATQPAVSDEVAPGVYRVDGMKFQMSGW